MIWIYKFKDGTNLKLLNSLSSTDLEKLMKEHGGSVIIDFEGRYNKGGQTYVKR